MTTIHLAAPVTENGGIERRFGRTPRMAVATAMDGQVSQWQEYQVDWDVLHDEAGEGSHHARIVRFMREHDIAAVVADHMGPPMVNTLTKLGLALIMPAPNPDARIAVQQAAASLAAQEQVVRDQPAQD